MKRTTHTSYRIGFSCGLSFTTQSAYKDALQYKIPDGHFGAFRRGYLEARKIMRMWARERNKPLPVLIVG